MGCRVRQSSTSLGRTHVSALAQQPRQLKFCIGLAAAVLLLPLIMNVAGADDLASTTTTATPGSADRQRIDDLRNSIFQSLGLTRIPDLTKANISQAEYERAHKEYYHLTRSRRSITNEEEGEESSHYHSTRRKLFSAYAQQITSTEDGSVLNFSLNINEYAPPQLDSATLRLLLDHNEDDREDDRLEIRVYDEAFNLLSQLSTNDPGNIRRRWLEFDLGDGLELTEDPLRLMVQVLRKNRQKDDAIYHRIEKAALNLHTTEQPPSWLTVFRGKRSIGGESSRLPSLHRGRRTECHGKGAKRCCRHHMSVTFKELEGFDFIIQPKNFDAGYCKGRCPPRYNPAHHHALLQSLIWKEDRHKAPRPCCAPSKLAELEILYFDEDDSTKLKVSNWKDMRVLECACS
uniref:TGF-beta family profile domain-containing protein n=1 Tax=Trichogramma kaykai TaxID=54128 RepID=A0ABD2W161_9HYME